MNMLTIKLINFCYLMRMFKDKSYQSLLNWYYGGPKNIERIYKENETVYSCAAKLLCNSMTPIIDNIILGNARDASFLSYLEMAKVGAIIDVTTEIPNYFPNKFTYYTIKINDNNKEPFTIDMLESVCEFMDAYNMTNNKNTSTNNKKQNIFVHCYMGSSRSATVVMAYMIYKYGYTVEQCLEIVKAKREIMNITVLFKKNLEEFYIHCKKDE